MRMERAFGPRSLWIGVGNPLSARLAEQYHPDALWVSGYCASAELKGAPDMSLVSASELMELARRICLATESIPIVLDCDTGFGDEYIWRAFVEEACRTAELAGLCIEDKRFPKRNSFYDGWAQELSPIDEFQRMIEVAVEVRDARRCRTRILARTEALVAGSSVDAALSRLVAYKTAKPDAFFVQARQSQDDLLSILRQLKGGDTPIVVAPSAFPQFSAADWWSAGASVVVHANQLLRAGLRAQQQALGLLLNPDTRPGSLDNEMWTMDNLNRLVARAPTNPDRQR